MAPVLFLELADDMLQIAHDYRDRVHFAFKPHPKLRFTLEQQPGWGVEKTDAYYKTWQEMPNGQLELGVYTDLFKQSDAMLHDCGSFSVEYLFMDKPCMYLQKEDRGVMNQMTRDAVACHEAGKTGREIREFIDGSVLGNSDPMRAKRAAFREKYLLPPNGCSAAQNIIRAILGE